jgi:hypothetical protein
MLGFLQWAMGFLLNRIGGYQASHVLVDKDRVSVRIDRDETGRTGGTFIGLVDYLHALLFQSAL